MRQRRRRLGPSEMYVVPQPQLRRKSLQLAATRAIADHEQAGVRMAGEDVREPSNQILYALLPGQTAHEEDALLRIPIARPLSTEALGVNAHRHDLGPVASARRHLREGRRHIPADHGHRVAARSHCSAQRVEEPTAQAVDIASVSGQHHRNPQDSAHEHGHDPLGHEPVGVDHVRARGSRQPQSRGELGKHQKGRLEEEPRASAEVLEHGAVGEALQRARPEVMEPPYFDSLKRICLGGASGGGCEHRHLEVRQKMTAQLEHKGRRGVVEPLRECAGQDQQRGPGRRACRHWATPFAGTRLAKAALRRWLHGERPVSGAHRSRRRGRR